MGLLDGIGSPEDLRRLAPEAMPALADEIRAVLVDQVTRSGGHLGPNLGVVELTIALHRVFRSPGDAILFDTGHQAYVHKMLTGRQTGFGRLRKQGGLSGYPSRAESPHDVIENSHASTSLAYADGIAKGWQRSGELGQRHVVAVIGDGALTGGMAWEALNNIAAAKDRPVVIVVNDNERSYSTTIGGLAHHLATLRTTRGYERFLLWGKRFLRRTPVVGPPVYETLHGVKKGIKDVVAPQGMFEDLGLKYVGPVDGHDVAALEHALRRAKGYAGPVIVHAITEKGHGYRPAVEDEADRFHSVAACDPDTGLPPAGGATSWTAVFAATLVELGRERDDIVAITAAMPGPTGLDVFGRAFPGRCYDVGIAEQHAVTSAAGLAFTGLHPVVAVYATFLNRAYDQVLLDVALHRAPVTFALDRAGVTGEDGPSHNGVWDLALLSAVPGLRVAAPRDGDELAALLREAVGVDDGPTVVRFPKGAVPPAQPSLQRTGGCDLLRLPATSDTPADVLVVSVGGLAGLCLAVADRLADHGVSVTVLDPRWVLPVPAEVTARAAHHRLVVTVEDGVRMGGVGSAVALALQDAGVGTPVRCFGLPASFLAQGSRAEVLADNGLTAQDIARAVVEEVAHLDEYRAAPAGPLGALADEGHPADG
ncbi:MAG: 1-deoxy-D-xylulose-5-phosphate synthase [Actinomycetota bacterium]|nr:MAG: 1-deoxy-D-xylulose-5-phosphate synthase [Actinomycetota bacterium]